MRNSEILDGGDKQASPGQPRLGQMPIGTARAVATTGTERHAGH